MSCRLWRGEGPLGAAHGNAWLVVELLKERGHWLLLPHHLLPPGHRHTRRLQRHAVHTQPGLGRARRQRALHRHAQAAAGFGRDLDRGLHAHEAQLAQAVDARSAGAEGDQGLLGGAVLGARAICRQTLFNPFIFIIHHMNKL